MYTQVPFSSNQFDAMSVIVLTRDPNPNKHVSERDTRSNNIYQNMTSDSIIYWNVTLDLIMC